MPFGLAVLSLQRDGFLLEPGFPKMTILFTQQLEKRLSPMSGNAGALIKFVRPEAEI
jgi:hypothetical protein